VYYRLTFAVDVDGSEAVPFEELVLTRDYPFDETQVLGKANEEQLIMQAIARDLVGLLSRRLSAID
jgi:LPS-assembly lipoprotein